MRGRRRLAGFGAAAGVGIAVVVGSFGAQAAADETATASADPPSEESPAAPSRDTAEHQQRLAEGQQRAEYANQWSPLVQQDAAPPKPAQSEPPPTDIGAAAADHLDSVVEPVAKSLAPTDQLSSLIGPDARGAFTPVPRILQDAIVRTSRVDVPTAAFPAVVIPGTSDTSSDTANRRGEPGAASATSAAVTGATTAAKPTKLDDTSATTALSPLAGSSAPAWSAAAVGPGVDERLAERWRTSPVRGPPTVADALGNDGRTTIWQVAVVVGEEGPQVVITSQRIAVSNAGSAVAVATGQGSAQATGDLARTSVTQVSVVVLRGPGSATVHQSVGVANRGLGVAASTGDGSASAVGNASVTAVDQTVVVIVLGSGHGTVGQSAEVDNAGAAYALATDKDSSAVGTNSTTQIRQTAVVMVHDDDVTVNQNAAVVNHGVGAATGATSTGNEANTAIDQTTVQR